MTATKHTLMTLFAIVFLAASSTEAETLDIAKECDLQPQVLSTLNDGKSLRGVYAGRWSWVLAHALIVTEVRGDRVKAYYAHGAHSPWGIDRPNCGPIEGTIATNATNGSQIMKFTIDGGDAQVDYWVEDNGETLSGNYQRRGRSSSSQGTFRRVPDDSLTTAISVD